MPLSATCNNVAPYVAQVPDTPARVRVLRFVRWMTCHYCPSMLFAVATCVCLLKAFICVTIALRLSESSDSSQPLSPQHLIVYLILKLYNKCHFLIVFAIFFAVFRCFISVLNGVGSPCMPFFTSRLRSTLYLCGGQNHLNHFSQIFT